MDPRKSFAGKNIGLSRKTSFRYPHVQFRDPRIFFNFQLNSDTKLLIRKLINHEIGQIIRRLFYFFTIASIIIFRKKILVSLNSQ